MLNELSKIWRFEWTGGISYLIYAVMHIHSQAQSQEYIVKDSNFIHQIYNIYNIQNINFIIVIYQNVTDINH